MNVKQISLQNFPTHAFYTLSGEPVSGAAALSYAKIPWVFGCADKLSRTVSAVPYKLVHDDGRVWTSLGDETSPIPWFTKRWKTTSYKVTFDGLTSGAGYIHNTARDFKHLTKASMTPERGVDGRIVGFRRQTITEQKIMRRKQVVTFFYTDPTVEDEPARMYPATVALEAGKVLKHFDELVSNYFENGTVGGKLLAMKAPTKPSERKEFAEWWGRRMQGIRRAFGAPKFLDPGAKIINVSDMLSDFYHESVIRDARREVEVSFSFPETVMNQSANLATKRGDQQEFIELVASPLCDWLAENINEQVNLGGWNIVYTPNRMQIMQQDEMEIAGPFGQYVAALVPPDMAARWVGIDASDADLERLVKIYEQRGVPFGLSSNGNIVNARNDTLTPDEEEVPKKKKEEETDKDALAEEARKIANWAKNRIREKKSFEAADFSSSVTSDIDKANIISGSTWRTVRFRATGSTIADNLISDFEEALLSLHNKLISGRVSQRDHEREFEKLIERLIEDLFYLGLGGESLDSWQSKVVTQMTSRQLALTQSILGDLRNGRYSMEEDGQLRNRIALWGSSLSVAMILGQLHSRRNVLYRWSTGTTSDNCDTCLSWAGKTGTAEVWLQRNVWPRGSMLECKGFNCGCVFEEIT